MRYLGLDLGSRTLGIAVSDPTGLIASSYGVIRHQEEYLQLVKKVKELVEELHIDQIVLGFPKNMNNTIGPKGELSIAFQKMLLAEISIPVVLEDERLTTKQANDVLIQADVSRKGRKSVVDEVAASLILQAYLDRREKK